MWDFVSVILGNDSLLTMSNLGIKTTYDNLLICIEFGIYFFPHENEEIVKNFVNALNECKFEKAADFVHDDFEFMDEWFEYVEFYKNIPPDPLEMVNGKDGWLNRHKYNAKSLKGLRRIILKMMSQGDDVWIWSKRKGIHSSDFDGFPATKKELDLYSFVMIFFVYTFSSIIRKRVLHVQQPYI